MSAARIAVFALALMVMWPGSAAAQLLSPGPLSKAHKSLEGDDKCSNCHSSGKKISSKPCLACHKDLARRVRAGAGLHGKTYRGKKCERCHIEHLGRKTRLVRWPGKKRENFKHAEGGWTLRGDHRTQSCAKCHTKRNSRGAKTYLGLSKECTTCHLDEHEGRMGKNCLSCHSQTTWKQVDIKNIENFNHDRARFKLRGKHKPVACDKCHGSPAKWTGFRFERCVDCHKDPHRGKFRKRRCSSCHSDSGWKDLRRFRGRHPGLRLSKGHRRVTCKRCHDRGNMRAPSKGRKCVNCHKKVHKASFGNNCKSCHASIQWTGLKPAVGRKHHRKTQYPLAGRHRKTPCAKCHPTSKKPAKRYRGIPFDRCDGCHEDKHGGDFKKTNRGECARCHKVSGFRPSSFGAKLHATTGFPLDGRHLATPCAGCHKGSRPRLHWKIASQSCVDCHDNPHGTQFESEMGVNGCATCHNTGGFRRPNIDHKIWPLEGAHARTDCGGCHNPSAKDRKSGKGATYRGVPRNCEGCHEDFHAGQFRLTNPSRNCAFCHTTGRFKVASFDHKSKGRYELIGGHKQLTCERCHRTEKLRNGKSATRYRLGYRACKDCHKNPHVN